jgi:phage pi2 protein 07
LIKDDWIKFVIDNPAKTQVQSDGRIKKWAEIPEAHKYLRVILLEDGETVHNAFFDTNARLWEFSYQEMIRQAA